MAGWLGASGRFALGGGGTLLRGAGDLVPRTDSGILGEIEREAREIFAAGRCAGLGAAGRRIAMEIANPNGKMVEMALAAGRDSLRRREEGEPAEAFAWMAARMAAERGEAEWLSEWEADALREGIREMEREKDLEAARGRQPRKHGKAKERGKSPSEERRESQERLAGGVLALMVRSERGGDPEWGEEQARSALELLERAGSGAGDGAGGAAARGRAGGGGGEAAASGALNQALTVQRGVRLARREASPEDSRASRASRPLL